MPRVKFTEKIDAKLLDFTWKKSKLRKFSQRLPDFLDDSPFNIRNQNEILQWAERLTFLLSKLHASRDFILATKIRMLFATGQPITTDNNFLQKVKNHADHLELDVHNRIMEFKKDDLELTADWELAEQHNENLNLLNFVTEKLKNVQEPMSVEAIFKDYSEFLWVAKRKEMRFRQITPLIHKFHHLDLDTKIRILFLLEIPIDPEFLKEIHPLMETIEIDNHHKILHFKKLAPCQEPIKLELQVAEEVELHSEPATTSYKDFFELLKNVEHFLSSEQFSMARQMINEGDLKFQKIDIASIRLALENILELSIPTKFFIGNPHEESTDRCEFLKVLRSTVENLKIPEFNDILEKIDELTSKLSDSEDQISRKSP